MISTKSADFFRNNQVLARHKILQIESWTNGKKRDFIDADNSGGENYVRGGFGDNISGRITRTTTEPALVTPYRDIENFAVNNGTEVVTQDQVGELQAKNSKHIAMNFGALKRLNYSQEKDINVRTLSDVARELNPFPASRPPGPSIQSPRNSSSTVPARGTDLWRCWKIRGPLFKSFSRIFEDFGAYYGSYVRLADSPYYRYFQSGCAGGYRQTDGGRQWG